MKPSDWEKLLGRLRAYPAGVHKILPPCPDDRLETVQIQLGRMPQVLLAMLRNFNGARLFVSGGPLVSVFGISTVPLRPPLEWAPEWYIDRFTPAWRTTHNQSSDWAVAMTNYGGLILLDQHGMISEWDTSERAWGQKRLELSQWVEDVMREGDAALRE